jgi:hypothetical protein
MTKNHFLRHFVLFLAALAALSGCGQLDLAFGSLLSNVSIEPNLITPNADGDDDVALIRYSLRRSATIDLYFEDASGKRYYFRKEQRRAPDSYDVYWGGVIDDRYTIENAYGVQEILSSVLPNGRYRWTFSASEENGQSQSVQGEITVQDADNQLPELRNFVVIPEVFTPNQDSIDDEVSISYYLSKDVDKLLVFLLDPKDPDVRYFIPDEPGVVPPAGKGPHEHRYTASLDLNAEPPTDGDYLVVIEVHDKAGNAVRVERPLRIEEGGKPRADIEGGEIDWQREMNRVVSINQGEKLCFQSVVVNESAVPIRTSGPWPGQEYNFSENVNTLAQRSERETGDASWYQQAGVFRFGINYDTAASDFPFRWAIGRQEDLERRLVNGQEQWYLLPGKRGLVSGCILFDELPPVGTNLWHGGLLHEFVDVPNNYVDRISVQVGRP